MKKAEYQAPQMESVHFLQSDILAASAGYDPEASEGGGWDSGEMPLGID